MSSNITPFQGQRYLLTYPEKNAVWWSPTPNKCYSQKKKECCQRMLYTPTPANQCSSTFMPWDRPSPNECLKLCKGIDNVKINGCKAQQFQHRRKVINNGCLMEPSVAQYTNKPFNDLCLKNDCKSNSILTDPKRNPPPPAQYGMKYSNTYDPILWNYGYAYTY